MLRQIPRRRLPRLAALLVAAAVGSLVLASTAWGAPTITRSSGSGQYWNATSPTPSYVISDESGEEVTWSVPGFTAGTLPAGGGVVTLTGFPQGDGSLTAHPTANPADATTVSFTVDTTPPSVSVALDGTLSATGWYRSPLSIRAVCAEPGCSPAAPFPWSAAEGAGLTAQGSATDSAGNPGTGNTAPFNYDATQPTAASSSAPVEGSQVASEPEFRWIGGSDALSGVDRYELQFRNVTEETAFQTFAQQNATALGDYVVNRGPGATPALPQGDLLEWRVVTFDNAGNSRNSVPPYRLTIDSTIPPPPVITGGPSTPIRFTSPTFTWTGTQPSYLWDLFIPGRTTPVRSGAGAATETTLQSLADGDYTFRVIQVTPFGQRSEGAVRSFKVDTTPPVAPEITVRPPFPAAGVITFGWSQEPGAFSRWQVNGAGGAAILGPADSLLNSVSIANLADGAYSFQVMQIDAAGNASATTVEPFTVTTPLAPGAAPSGNPKIEPEFLLPSQNAFRLRPKAGRTLPTRRPVLGWQKGPRGTRLYNVQIFKVVKKRAGKAPTVKKVYSGFPSKRQMRAPKSKMQPGACYVWRVWPYTGTKFTPKPLGISNFCVAKASVLKKKAIQAARRKADQRRR